MVRVVANSLFNGFAICVLLNSSVLLYLVIHPPPQVVIFRPWHCWMSTKVVAAYSIRVHGWFVLDECRLIGGQCLSLLYFIIDVLRPSIVRKGRCPVLRLQGLRLR